MLMDWLFKLNCLEILCDIWLSKSQGGNFSPQELNSNERAENV